MATLKYPFEMQGFLFSGQIEKFPYTEVEKKSSVFCKMLPERAYLKARVTIYESIFTAVLCRFYLLSWCGSLCLGPQYAYWCHRH